MPAAAENEAPSPRDAVRLAVIGDLHDSWSDFDVAHLNASDYDGVIFVGDLGRGAATSERICRSVARLTPPTLVMPGNADAPHHPRLRAEFSVQRGLGRLLEDAPGPARPGLGPDFEGVRLCGYSLHRIAHPGLDLSVVCGRPFSLGGPELSFGPELHGSYGIGSLDDSAKRLCELVDAAGSEALVFVSHNGPTGLGDDPGDPWGCDFRPDRLDWGDPDLGQAVAHARRRGRRVLAVVAGHMHLGLKDGRERTWLRRQGETLFVNPARVPRIARREGREAHHHVALRIAASGAEAEEVFVTP
jgi:uncharacterized protein (TIGR04168 family)